MRSLSESGIKILAKVPNTEWVTGRMEKLVAGCNKGYAKLQSGRISKGRLTMQDMTDERATNAWSERVWTKDGGVEQWPKALRPQRPEQITLNMHTQYKTEAKRNKLKQLTNPNMDVIEDDELLGMEIMREIRMTHDELTKKREQVTQQAKRIQDLVKETDDLRLKVKKCEGEVQEVKAALSVRTEATQRLESQNGTLRDSVAKLQVQVDTNKEERDNLIQRWQAAEKDRQNWKSQCEELQDSATVTNSYKQQCLHIQNQIRSSITKITSQQDFLQKDLTRLETAAHDALTFAQTVDSRTKLQETQIKELVTVAEEAQQKLLQLSAVLAEVRKERDDLVLAKSESNGENSQYFAEWQKYQQETGKRIDGLIGENERLMQELELSRQMQDKHVCLNCLQVAPNTVTLNFS